MGEARKKVAEIFELKKCLVVVYFGDQESISFVAQDGSKTEEKDEGSAIR